MKLVQCLSLFECSLAIFNQCHQIHYLVGFNVLHRLPQSLHYKYTTNVENFLNFT